MKVAQFSLPLSAVLVIGLNQSALAGPQSLLDPYANVKAPTKKSVAKNAVPVARPAAPTSVVINGPDLPPVKKEKPVKQKPIASQPSPEPIVSKSSEPKSSTKDSGTGEGGFLAGTKEIFHGFGTAAKGAVLAPTHAITSGSKKVAGGTKNIGEKLGDSTKGLTSKMADGTKSGGGIFVKGAKSVGHGFKAMGGKIKDGTVAAAHAVPFVGGHDDKPVEKVASKAAPEKISSKAAPISTPAPEKVKDLGGESLTGKVLAMPKTVGKGIVGAAAKTGEATKKVAGAPIGFFGKLNPFHHKSAPAIETAGKPVNPVK
jgi:hypothetical protein